MVVAVFESTLENISHPISGNLLEHWWKLVYMQQTVDERSSHQLAVSPRKDPESTGRLTSWCQVI